MSAIARLTIDINHFSKIMSICQYVFDENFSYLLDFFRFFLYTFTY